MRLGCYGSVVTQWSDLTQELDAWTADGRRATLWWRDDDAAEPDAALERLLALAATHGLPLALAVIPARATRALAQRLAEADEIAAAFAFLASDDASYITGHNLVVDAGLTAHGYSIPDPA